LQIDFKIRRTPFVPLCFFVAKNLKGVRILASLPRFFRILRQPTQRKHNFFTPTSLCIDEEGE
jgi:hypothetical protein